MGFRKAIKGLKTCSVFSLGSYVCIFWEVVKRLLAKLGIELKFMERLEQMIYVVLNVELESK